MVKRKPFKNSSYYMREMDRKAVLISAKTTHKDCWTVQEGRRRRLNGWQGKVHYIASRATCHMNHFHVKGFIRLLGWLAKTIINRPKGLRFEFITIRPVIFLPVSLFWMAYKAENGELNVLFHTRVAAAAPSVEPLKWQSKCVQYKVKSSCWTMNLIGKFEYWWS